MYNVMKMASMYITYMKNLKFDQLFPNLYNAIAMRDDKNAIPEKIKII
jgi:hypothetical protein